MFLFPMRRKKKTKKSSTSDESAGPSVDLDLDVGQKGHQNTVGLLDELQGTRQRSASLVDFTDVLAQSDLRPERKLHLLDLTKTSTRRPDSLPSPVQPITPTSVFDFDDEEQEPAPEKEELDGSNNTGTTASSSSSATTPKKTTPKKKKASKAAPTTQDEPKLSANGKKRPNPLALHRMGSSTGALPLARAVLPPPVLSPGSKDTTCIPSSTEMPKVSPFTVAASTSSVAVLSALRKPSSSSPTAPRRAPSPVLSPTSPPISSSPLSTLSTSSSSSSSSFSSASSSLSSTPSSLMEPGALRIIPQDGDTAQHVDATRAQSAPVLKGHSPSHNHALTVPLPSTSPSSAKASPSSSGSGSSPVALTLQLDSMSRLRSRSTSLGENQLPKPLILPLAHVHASTSALPDHADNNPHLNRSAGSPHPLGISSKEKDSPQLGAVPFMRKGIRSRSLNPSDEEAVVRQQIIELEKQLNLLHRKFKRLNRHSQRLSADEMSLAASGQDSGTSGDESDSKTSSSSPFLPQLRSTLFASTPNGSRASLPPSRSLFPSFLAIRTNELDKRQRLTGGQQASCQLYEAYVDGWQCVVKELHCDTDKDSEQMLREINLLQSLPHHPNLVRYLHHEVVGDRIRLFLKRYEGCLTDRLKVLREENRQFDANVLRTILRDIASGLAFLHENNIIHRDIKSENILILMDDQKEIVQCAIADFDVAKRITAIDRPNTCVGTPSFIAPEVLSCNGTQSYSLKADIHSFGMLIFELMTLRPPYTECKRQFDITQRILDGEPPVLPTDLPESYKLFVKLFRKCTKLNPQKRPSAIQILTYL